MGARDLTFSYADASALVHATLARALAPRKPLMVSQWADLYRRLSSKGSAMGNSAWRTDRNPPLREPMDALSARTGPGDVVLKFPIQFGKTEVAINALGYTVEHDPCPIMVCLPGEVSMEKWVAQKLNPMLEETQVVRDCLTSTASRDGANRRNFKDFEGGQLYIEHAGSPQRLKSTTVRKLLVDEVDEFAASLTTGDDPVEMLEGRTSAYPGTYKRLWISTPSLKGVSRIDHLYDKSDQRRYYVPCPHCGHEQPLEWSGLHWAPGGHGAHYICRECGAQIDEHHKTAMILAGRWVAENPGAKVRGYTINCLYYQIGLGPRWETLVAKWLEVQHDPAKLKTFVNDRLAESWEDPSMRAVKQNAVRDRAEPYAMRTVPAGGLVLTAGVDTQDDRLEVSIIAWGRNLAFWVVDYVILPGDPANTDVWTSLTELLNTPLQHESGALLHIQAYANDAGGHRTEAVKDYVRQRRVRRPMAIFGAVPNNAPVLSKGKLHDVDWKGRYDKRGVMVYHVGTVAVKHWLYGRLSTDHEKDPTDRLCHFSNELPPEYFAGLVSETYNPAKNRFEKRRGARNEPLDTWGYAYAAAHHPELRLHRYRAADWDRLEAALRARAGQPAADVQDKTDGQPEATAPADVQRPMVRGIRRIGRVGGH